MDNTKKAKFWETLCGITQLEHCQAWIGLFRLSDLSSELWTSSLSVWCSTKQIIIREMIKIDLTLTAFLKLLELYCNIFYPNIYQYSTKP